MMPGHAGGQGSESMMQAIMGVHMNPILALLLVVGLIFMTPWCLRRFRHRMPALLKEDGMKDRALKVQEAIPLGAKRTLFSVAVRGAGGRQATAVILTGGPSDLCVGWLEAGDSPAPEQPMRKKEQRQAKT